MNLTFPNIKNLLSLLLFVAKKHNLIQLEPILKYKLEIGMQLAEKHGRKSIDCPNS